MVSNTKNISDGWQQTTVDKVLIRYFTGPSPTCEERNISNSEEWGVLKTTAVTWKGWNLSAHKTLPEKYWGLSNLEVHAGDVLITKAGPRHRCGVIVFVDHTIPHLIVSGKMVGLRPDTKKVLPLILSLALAQSNAQKYLDVRTTGMAESQLNFTNENLLKTPITIPPLPEQNVIFNIWSSLDKAIKKTDQLIEKYKSIKQGLMQDLFRYGIDEKGLIRNEKTHQFKDSPLGRIPEEWRVETLSKIAVVNMGQSPSSSFVNDHEIGIPFLQGNADFTLKYPQPTQWVTSPKKICKIHDVLISVRAPVGEINIADAKYCIGRGLAALTFMINKRFGWYLIACNKNRLLVYAQGSTFTAIGRADLDNLKLALPTNQKEMEAISQKISQADDVIEKDVSYKQKLISLKKGLMDDLLSSKVRVNHLTN